MGKILEDATIASLNLLGQAIPGKGLGEQIDDALDGATREGNSSIGAVLNRVALLITNVNTLRREVMAGEDPHKANDEADVVVAEDSFDSVSLQVLSAQLQMYYSAHIGSTNFHRIGDSSNQISSNSFVYLLLVVGLMVGQTYEAHRVLLTREDDFPVHVVADETNAFSNFNLPDYIPFSAATLSAMLNDIKDLFNAHMRNATSHLVADTENIIDVEDLDESFVVADAVDTVNAILAGYEAHIAIGEDDIADTFTDLAEDIADQYEAHRILVGALEEQVHHEADETNEITEDEPTDKASLVTYLNDIKAQFNAHCGNTDVHTVADSTNTLGLSDLAEYSTWETIKTFINTLKTKYEAHRVLHDTDYLSTFSPLAEDIADQYEAHRVQVGDPGEEVHVSADSTHALSESEPTDKDSLITFLNDIKTQFNLHCADTSSHRSADATSPVSVEDLDSDASWSGIKAMINALRSAYEAHRVREDSDYTDDFTDLATDIANQYEAHRMLVGDAGVEVHLVADETNVLSASAPTTRELLIAYLNDIRGMFNAHCALLTSHRAVDAVNPIVLDALNSNASWTQIKTMANTLRTAYEAHRVLHDTDYTDTIAALAEDVADKYEAHRVLVGEGEAQVHLIADALNEIIADEPSTREELITFLNDIKIQFNAHCANVNVAAHRVADTANAIVLGSLEYNSSWNTIKTFVNTLRTAYEAHRVIADIDYTTAMTALAEDIADQYEAHRILVGDAGVEVHLAADETNEITESEPTDKASLIDFLNDIKAQFNGHCGNTSAHQVADTTNPIALDDLDESSLWTEIKAMINGLRSAYEAHRAIADTDYTLTMAVLAEDIGDQYEAHRILVGDAGVEVHLAADSTHALSADEPTTREKLVTYANDIKTQFNLHCADTTSHTVADAVNPIVLDDLDANSSWSEIRTMINTLRTAYEAHRQIEDTDYFSTISPLAINIAQMYEEHRVLAGVSQVHINSDAAHEITEPVPTTREGLVDYLNDIKAQFNAHCAYLTSHTVADVTNPIALGDLDPDSSWTAIKAMTNGLRTAYEAHRILITNDTHLHADIVNLITVSAVGAIVDKAHVYADDTNQITEGAISDPVTLKSHIYADSTNDVTESAIGTVLDKCHLFADATNTIAESAIGAVVDKCHVYTDDTNAISESAIGQVSEGVHIYADTDNDVTELAVGTITDKAHLFADGTNVITENSITTLTTAAHYNADTANTLGASPIDVDDALADTYLFLNGLKVLFNQHISNTIVGEGTSEQGIHYVVDRSMEITTVDASTPTTAYALANVLKSSFNDHISRATELATGEIPAL